jgi:hypothetical protein
VQYEGLGAEKAATQTSRGSLFAKDEEGRTSFLKKRSKKLLLVSMMLHRNH